jgi:energy-coupling factor transporter ATP-binding protein EcfA2/energy-coupling factor transporter transmembrane protein EcfT
MQTAGASGSPTPLLARLSDVGVTYDGGTSWAVRHVSLGLHEGEYVALVGPNGAGKTTLSRVVAGLLAPDEGRVELLGHAVFDADGPHPQDYRLARRGIGAVFQNPQDQILTTRVAEDVAFGPENLAIPEKALPGRVAEALADVGLEGLDGADPGRLSGGQQQRVALAGMLAMHPRLLVLDEPTAMLDPRARDQVLDILDRLHRRGTTILLVSHDPRVVAHASRVIRLGHGSDESDGMTGSAAHSLPSAAPSTFSATPLPPAAPSTFSATPLPSAGSSTISSVSCHAGSVVLEARDLSYRYSKDQPWVLRGVSLRLRAGQILALRGPNGSGKSTLLRLLAALALPAEGSIMLCGTTIRAGHRPSRREERAIRPAIGYVMQQPQRQLFADTVRQDVAFGPRNLLPDLGEDERGDLVDDALKLLGISDLSDRSPFDLSGGQQRLVALAGVLACHPRVLLLDEPSAGLDEAARWRLYAALRGCASRGTAILLVTHSDQEVRQLGATSMRIDRINHATAQEAALHEASAQSNLAQARTGRVPFLARTDPRSTLILMLAAMLTAFALTGPAQLMRALAGAAVFLALGRVGPRRLTRVLHPLLPLVILLAVVNLLVVRTGPVLVRIGALPLTRDGLWTAVVYSVRLVIILLLGCAVVEATSPVRLVDGLTGLLSPLARLGVHVQEIGLVLALALRFLPLIAQEAQDVLLAQRARGADITRGGPAHRIRSLFALCVPVFAACARHAGTTALALDARCYEEGITRTHLVPLRMTWRDGVLAAGVVTVLAAILALGAMGL